MKVLKVLLEKREDQNPIIFVNANGITETVLHHAAKYGHLDILQLIVRNINSKTKKTKRLEVALLKAAKRGHLEICQILKDTYNVLGKDLKIYAMAALIEKVADNGHFDLIAWIYDNNMTDE